MKDGKQHCGSCRETGHTTRTCPGMVEPSRARTKEVVDNLFGKDREEADTKQVMAPVRTPRIIFAARGPRYTAEGYVNPYQFNPKFAGCVTGAEVLGGI